jgi:hypothetical protein
MPLIDAGNSQRPHFPRHQQTENGSRDAEWCLPVGSTNRAASLSPGRPPIPCWGKRASSSRRVASTASTSVTRSAKMTRPLPAFRERHRPILTWIRIGSPGQGKSEAHPRHPQSRYEGHSQPENCRPGEPLG